MKSRLRAAQEVMTARTGGTGVSGRRELRGVGAARSDVGAAPVPACSQADLEPYADALRAGLAEGQGYIKLASMLKRDFGVTAGDSLVQRWVDAEKKRGSASASSSAIVSPMKRLAGVLGGGCARDVGCSEAATSSKDSSMHRCGSRCASIAGACAC